MTRTNDGLRPSERLEYGVTAILVNTATGETLMEVFRGRITTRQGTQLVADRCDELGPEWKVRVLSNPMTILSDLRNDGRERLARRRRAESVMLGGIGRMDLVETLPTMHGLRTSATFDRKRKAPE